MVDLALVIDGNRGKIGNRGRRCGLDQQGVASAPFGKALKNRNPPAMSPVQDHQYAVQAPNTIFVTRYVVGQTRARTDGSAREASIQKVKT
jgi:hypothetical protein